MYNIEYELRTYEKLQEKIKQIVNDENKYSVTKCEDLGKSQCGFPIEHYKIGNGPIHITYMGGCHGNEIISVDFVTQLMNNIAKGNMPYFNDKIFTIDFIPVQNPEGYAITTYAINSKTKDMSKEEFEKLDVPVVYGMEWLKKNGFTESEIEKIFCKNVMRIYRELLG